MAERELNILVSSAGRRVALVDIFRRTLTALGLRGRVLAADMSAVAAAFHAAYASFIVPPCTDPRFLSAILKLCKEQRVSLLVPTIDTELAIYAAAREQLQAAGVTVGISSPEAVRIANDKRCTHRWLSAAGFPTVRQAEVADVLVEPAAWSFPLLVKPARGSSSIGVARVSDVDELRRATGDGDYVVQTVATGVEYTIDVYVDRRHRCRCAVPRRRIEVRAGEVSKSMTVRSAPLIALARRLFETLPGAWGVHNVQVIAHGDDLRVIEINPRFGGGFPLSWTAGADFARWLVQEAMGEDPSADERWQDGLVMLRWDAAVFVDRASAGL